MFFLFKTLRFFVLTLVLTLVGVATVIHFADQPFMQTSTVALRANLQKTTPFMGRCVTSLGQNLYHHGADTVDVQVNATQSNTFKERWGLKIQLLQNRLAQTYLSWDRKRMEHKLARLEGKAPPEISFQDRIIQGLHAVGQSLPWSHPEPDKTKAN